ncbi:MAG: hypothetical protein GY861_12055 [bacterium]|nr:hypothetical protein [bacterium]
MDPDIVIETSTPSEEVFKIPATPKAKEDSLIIMATPEERAVQVQQKEDPFKNFVEVEAPAHIFLTEDQYYAKDTLLGKYTILNRETPRPKITEPISTPTVATAIVASVAKTALKLREPFGALAKDEWEPEGSTKNNYKRKPALFFTSMVQHIRCTNERRWIWIRR